MKQFPECSTDGELISAGDVSKCLRCCWREDLVATSAAEENIANESSEKLFPYCGIGVFLGDLSTLPPGH